MYLYLKTMYFSSNAQYDITNVDRKKIYFSIILNKSYVKLKSHRNDEINTKELWCVRMKSCKTINENKLECFSLMN